MDAVRLARRLVPMDHHSQDPFCPHPSFPQWTGLAGVIYPYQLWGNVQKFVVKQRYYMVTLENELLRVTIAPDIGGRIWDIYDKIGRKHLANFNNTVLSNNSGFGSNYTAGGVECNYPLAHSCTTNQPREVSTRRHADGSAAVIISEYERIWRTRWSVSYRLYPGRSFVELGVRIYNRTPYDSRYMYWNNCGFELDEATEFIFPESAGAMHGSAQDRFSWPIWRNRDLSKWRDQPPEMLGLYMLDAREPFFGYYDHKEQIGLVHYSDLADLPGKKLWTWGTQPSVLSVLRNSHHSFGKLYGEVQSGRIAIQEHRDRVPPETESVWREIWYPVRGTGAFNGAGPGGALRAEVLESSNTGSRIQVTAIGNGFFPRARIVVMSDGAGSVEQAMPLDPKAPVTRVLALPGRAGPRQRTTVILRDVGGEILAVCRLKEPNKHDSWREVADRSASTAPTGVEELFAEAEVKARDCGNHDLRPCYEKALRLDEGFSPARRELGKIAMRQGLHDEAIEHFNRGLERAPDSLELQYSLGLALRNAGRPEEARKAFELSNRYDWEARSLVRLGEISMREKDWRRALNYLDRTAELHPRLTRPRGLRAACLRKLGHKEPAAAEIAEALAIDGQDPFLQVEAMFIATGCVQAARLPKTAVRALINQIRGQEPPLLEAAFDYLSEEMWAETEAVLRLIPKPGALSTLARAYVAHRLGREREAARLLEKGCRLAPAGQHPWRLEMQTILQWARTRLPRHPRLPFYLGHLMMAWRRTEEGVALWKEAEDLGERHALLFAALAHYTEAVAKQPLKALRYYQKAAAADPEDLYAKRDLAGALCAAGKLRQSVRFLEKNRKHVLGSPPLAFLLLNGYLDQGRYAKFDALCKRVDFSINWQLPGPGRLWVKRHLMEALALTKKGNFERALRLLKSLEHLPKHIGTVPAGADLAWFSPAAVGHYVADLDVRRCYHMACIHEKLGNLEEARRCWEQACAIPLYTGYEKGYWSFVWMQRYFQALSLQKLGRESEANAFFDAMELLVKLPDVPASAKEAIMNLVERGRFAPDAMKDPFERLTAEVTTTAEA